MQYEVPGCCGVTVEPLPPKGGEHVLYVRVAPGGEIPLHVHTVASGMEITKGVARALGKGEERWAKPGDYIFKPAGMPHGFMDVGPDGFEFISTANGQGILRDGEQWDFHQV
jgi:quercetin dioxygenase-like cupin family protein